MGKKLVLIIFICWGLILSAEASAATVTEEWVKRYNYGYIDWAKDIAVDSSGNSYVTGYSFGLGGYGYATIKYNSAGGQEWVARYSASLENRYYPMAIALDSAKNVYVTGTYKSTTTGFDYATVKYRASDGYQEWVVRYNGLGNGSDRAQDIAVDTAGNVYVTGYSFNGSNFDYVTIKYNSAGVPQWTSPARYDGSNVDLPRAMLLSEEGVQVYVYVTGNSYGSGTAYDYATIKYDAADGDEMWVARYNDPSNGRDEATAIAIDSSGKVYITGLSQNSSGLFDYVTLKYDVNGRLIWSATYNSFIDEAYYNPAIAIDSADNVYICGTILDPPTNLDYATVKYNSDGIQKWDAKYYGPAVTYSGDVTRAIALDKLNNVYVTGTSFGSSTTNLDYATVKYNSDGIQKWVARYNDPTIGSDDDPCAIALDNLSNVYVTGTSNNDYATIKYSQSVVIVVAIDIKPGSDPNSINLSSAGVIPVAILSSNTFNAATVDPAKVSLAGAGVKLVGKSDKYLSHEEDVNGDGLLDLVCQVNTAQFMIEPGESSAVLEANTFDGTPIRGEDFVRIIAE